jgi:RNase adaptor protein for sRNA GlmZ degradation
MLYVMHLVLISGLSGSGKSIALKVLEDANYYCVDNLPSQLLQPLVGQLELQGYDQVGVVIDIRGGDSVAMLPLQLDALRANNLELQFLFLDAQDATLIKRYSENAAPTSAGQRPDDLDRSHRRRTCSPWRAGCPRSPYGHQWSQSQHPA